MRSHDALQYSYKKLSRFNKSASIKLNLQKILIICQDKFEAISTHACHMTIMY